MEKKKWSFVNAENVVPYVCDETYSSKQLTGDELAGFPVININEGTLKGGCRTGGGAHEDTEIYYIVEGSGILWLDEDSIPVKPGDIIVIPPLSCSFFSLLHIFLLPYASFSAVFPLIPYAMFMFF